MMCTYFFNQFLILILSRACFLITENALILFSKVKCVSIPRLLNSKADWVISMSGKHQFNNEREKKVEVKFSEERTWDLK